MNQLTLLEFPDETSYRLIQIHEYDFLQSVFDFIKSHFTNGNSISTFCFILNNSSNNYFQELLSDKSFVLELNRLVKSKLDIVWCEPNINVNDEEKKSFEYFDSLHKPDPTTVWPTFSSRLVSRKVFSQKKIQSIYPCILLLKARNEGNQTSSDININLLESCIISLDKYDNYNNVVLFKNDLLNIFEQIISNIKNHNSTTFFSDLERREIFSQVLKEYKATSVKYVKENKLYNNFYDFMSDILENTGI